MQEATVLIRQPIIDMLYKVAATVKFPLAKLDRKEIRRHHEPSKVPAHGFQPPPRFRRVSSLFPITLR